MGVRVPGLLLIVLPIVIAGAVLGLVGGRGVSVFKKQGVAWGLTALMIVAAIGIGYAKAPVNDPVSDVPQITPPLSETVPPDLQQGATAPNAAAAGYFERDDAGVLSDRALTTLTARNQRLYEKYGVVIGVVTCNYGRDDLYGYALKRAGEMELTGYDFLVVLDIRGDNYWLIQGTDLADDFTDDDCGDYAWNYMEDAFAAGDYDRAVLDLTEMLELWYGIYFG